THPQRYIQIALENIPVLPLETPIVPLSLSIGHQNPAHYFPYTSSHRARKFLQRSDNRALNNFDGSLLLESNLHFSNLVVDLVHFSPYTFLDLYQALSYIP